jgi:DNA polymerase III subunit gamma/tau
MARIEALEAALAGTRPAPAPAPVAPPDAAPAPERATPAPAPPADDAGKAPEAQPEAAAASVAVADPPAPAPAPPVSVPAPDGIEGMVAVWPAVLDAVCADNQMLGAVLSDARPVELRDGELVVAFAADETFNQKQASLPHHRAIVEEAVRGLAGRSMRVSFELRDLEPADAENTTPPPTEDEIVARFVAEFDAEEIVPDPDDDKEGEA